MSMRTVVEIALQFESFRNIDLFHQGLYHLKTRLYREDRELRYLATPYSHFSCSPQNVEERPANGKQKADHHHLIPAHIIEEQHTFSTRSFLIRYCEEEVELDDVGLFRIEYEEADAASEDGAPILLEVDLMFADLTTHGGADRFGEHPDVDSTEFKSVSSQLFRLHSVESGLHELCPVVFDEFHFCLANLLVHTCVLDFRLRINPIDFVLMPQKPAIGQDKAVDDADAASALSGATAPRAPATVVALRPGERVDLGLGPGAGPGGAGAGASSPSRGPASRSASRSARGALPVCGNSALTMADWLAHAGGANCDALSAAEGVYRRQLGALASSYARQSEWYRTIIGRCFTSSHREALQISDKVADLILPEGLEFFPRSPSSSSAAPPPHGSLASSASAPTATWGRGGLVVEAKGLREALTTRLGRQPSASALATALAADVAQVSCQLLELWHQVLTVMPYATHEVAMLLRATLEEQMAEQWGVTVDTETMSGSVAEPEDFTVCSRHDTFAETVSRHAKAKPPLLVEDLALLPPMEERPVLFEQRYLPKSMSQQVRGLDANVSARRLYPSEPKTYRGTHLFVLVHGFQGNAFDMRLMKNNLALLFPEAIFLCSSSNEDNTEGDFHDMGIRLAQEVVNYISDWCPGQALGRLSFIAHSIGGLIVRSALPMLHEYASKMHTVLTLSTPHVGYFLKNTSLFNVGLRVLQSWRQSQCLSQLAMADADSPKECFLYKLSQTKGFEFFEHVVLVSCTADQYSPFDSARVEIGNMRDKHLYKEVYMEMVRNIWSDVEPHKVTRFDVNFFLGEQSLDTFIGRAAHIQFLECQPIMKMIIHLYSHMFR